MEMLNRATENAAAFKDMIQKIERPERYGQAVRQASTEVADWNAEVDRKRAEKKARKTQHTKALDGLR